MKTPRILWTLSLLLLAASPAAAYDAYGFQFDAGNLSHCSVVNVSAYPMVMGCLVQDMTNPANPVDLGHGVSRLLQPGESQELTYAVRVPQCAKAQIDGLINLQPWQLAIERWTESDIANSRVTALGQYVQLGACAPTPPTPNPQPPPSCPTYTYNVGGSPAIARFPPGYVNPWLPTTRGPFYLYVPAGRYRMTAVMGDNHVGPGGKNDGPQPQEIAWIVLDYGQWIGPTKDVDDDKNESVSTFRVNLLMDVQKFWVVHAGTRVVTEPTDSVYPVQITFTCVE